jgi:hypothetical protein
MSNERKPHFASTVNEQAKEIHDKFISETERTMLVEFLPSYCKFVLETQNEHNRHLNETKASIYAKDMRDGKWKRNGETVKFSKSGRLLDGQHRLAGCVQANKPFVSFVVLGLEDETFDTIDVGMKRTPGNMLAMAGIGNSNLTAAAARAAMFLKPPSKIGNMRGGGATRVTEHEILDFVRAHPRVEYWSAFVKQHKGFSVFGNHALLAAMLFIFDSINPIAADDFSKKLLTGQNLGEDDPILMLRNRLIQINTMNRTTRKLLDVREVAASIVNGWNAYREGRKLTAVRGSTTVNGERKYPVILNR